MRLKIRYTDIHWWFWAATLVFIIAALAGWTTGFYVVMAISAMQVLFFLVQEKGLNAFPTQIRVVYFAMTLFGFWPDVRLFIYAVLLLGTIMVDLLRSLRHRAHAQSDALESGAPGSTRLALRRSSRRSR